MFIGEVGKVWKRLEKPDREGSVGLEKVRKA